MIEETGRVVAVDGDHVWIETIRQTACQACDLKAGCGQQVLSKAFGDKRMHIRMENTLDLAEGDHVILGLPEEALLRGSLVVYLLPLLFMLAGAIGAELLAGKGDLQVIAGGIAGLMAGFFLVRHRTSKSGYIEPPVLLRTAGHPG